MAIYHFSAKFIQRSRGANVVAAAAYRSASKLFSECCGQSHDFSAKSGVIHSEILLPAGAPERWKDRELFWNEVETVERRRNSQLAQEVEFSLPRELTKLEAVKLARDFTEHAFVAQGMVADLNVHWDIRPDGERNPHAHVLLSQREIHDGSFGLKHRPWSSRAQLMAWREAWSEFANARLAELGIDASIDHRSFRERNIPLEPNLYVGPASRQRVQDGQACERAAASRAIAERNGELLAKAPHVALEALTSRQSTFTEHELMRFVHRHTDRKEQFDRAMSALKASPELIYLGRDHKGDRRFSTRAMVALEQRLEEHAEKLSQRCNERLRQLRAPPLPLPDTKLGPGQRRALSHLISGGDLALVIGYAGSGKSTMLAAARGVWEAAGLRVLGTTLSGLAARNLETGSGIVSRTVASLEYAWAQGRDGLSRHDVLVVDEAALLGSRQMERLVSEVYRAGAKLVLVGDVGQLQAIEAGAAFRALVERHGAAEITEIRRQGQAWQRLATRELATGRTATAFARYEDAGHVSSHGARLEAMEGAVRAWNAIRMAHPHQTQAILAHTRADVARLNDLARREMCRAGALGQEITVDTDTGSQTLAVGDRLVFQRNSRALDVRNGSLGTLEAYDGRQISVRLDGPGQRRIQFDPDDYGAIGLGYATTIHKSQGVTVDHAHVLLTRGLDQHATYVAMSRHRSTLALHFALSDFRTRASLIETLARERLKDITLDYQKAFSKRRGISRLDPKPEMATRPLEMRSKPQRDLAADQARRSGVGRVDWDQLLSDMAARRQTGEVTRRPQAPSPPTQANTARERERERTRDPERDLGRER